MKTEEEVREALRRTATPEPEGGYEAARERVMGRVRHRFPPSEKPAPRYRLLRPMAASMTLAGVAFVLFLAWPEQSVKVDSLPSETQMNLFYGQHETHYAAHLGDESTEISLSGEPSEATQ